MGQMLTTPVTAVDSESFESRHFRVAVASMQGWRVSMEDAHIIRLAPGNEQDSLLTGVFDGHGGATIANYVSHNLPGRIIQHPTFKSNPSEAFRHSFLEVDSAMQNDISLRNDNSGSTAIMVLVKAGKVLCANVGDSRAIASRAGLVEQLSYDHKPMNQIEYDRILSAGGWVEFNRVNGNLALSRAFGDFEFKRNNQKTQHEQIVTAVPDFVVKDVSEDVEFIVLACDGIWDVLTMAEVVEFVRGRIAQGLEPVAICTDLVNRCLAPDCSAGGVGCDNMTVILICFLHGASYSSLVSKCQMPSANLVLNETVLSQNRSSRVLRDSKSNSGTNSAFSTNG